MKHLILMRIALSMATGLVLENEESHTLGTQLLLDPTTSHCSQMSPIEVTQEHRLLSHKRPIIVEKMKANRLPNHGKSSRPSELVLSIYGFQKADIVQEINSNCKTVQWYTNAKSLVGPKPEIVIHH